jgi:MFS family permease
VAPRLADVRRRRLGIDLAPLRSSAQYRRLFTGGFISFIGAQATYITVPFQLKGLTHSTIIVGLVGLVEVVPIVLFGLYGGVLADRLDRRTVIVATEVGELVATLGLFLNALRAHPSVALVFVGDVLVVACGALQTPSVAALNQSLVPHELQRAASALSQVRSTTAAIVGPSLGGLVVVAVGPAAGYLVNLGTFVISLALFVTLRAAPARGAGRERARLAEGLHYVATRRDVLGTYVVDLLAMVFAYPVVMLPFVAATYPERYALALLYLGLPVGALAATLTSSWTHRVHRYGRAVALASVGWGLGVALVGVGRNLEVALAGLAIAGGSDAVSGIFRQTMWNESIHPDLRGRMAGVELLSYSIGPTAGQFRAGLTAAWLGLRASFVWGGLVCAGTVGAATTGLRELWRFDARFDPHVAAVRAWRAAEGA